MEKVIVIVLNYNGWKDTVECINSFYKEVSYVKYEYTIVIVDNKSTNDSVKRIRELLPDTVLIESEFNGGYAYGNNIGIRYAKEHQADYICILNNDTFLVEDFLPDCINVLKNNRKVAFVGPMLINYADNLVQSAGGSVSLLKGKSYKWSEGSEYTEIPAGHIKTDIIFGAAMVFRSDLVESLGYIPENYFLFFEETEWCYRARKMGYSNIYLTEKIIRHKGSASLVNLSEMQVYLMERNRVLFVKRNGTPLEIGSFLLYDFFRMIYRALFHGVPFIKYSKFHLDGITEHFDPEYIDGNVIKHLKELQ